MFLYQRVINRYRQGGHFVRHDVIRGRYESGLILLNHFFAKPDTITLIDSSDRLELIYQRIDESVLFQKDQLPAWVMSNLSTHIQTKTNDSIQTSSPDSVDEVRTRYNQLKQSSTENLNEPPRF